MNNLYFEGGEFHGTIKPFPDAPDIFHIPILKLILNGDSDRPSKIAVYCKDRIDQLECLVVYKYDRT